MENKVIIRKKTRKRGKQVSKACSCSANCCESDILKNQEQAVVMPELNESYITGYVTTSVGNIPKVATNLTMKDRIGSWKVRWGINRMNYTVYPGLYCVGQPNENSHVLVTANYKLSFDTLRSKLVDLDAWILVLDTKGINVWCAAGKGTFGTDELVCRIAKVKLGDIVKHRNLILPQLGATGVAAHEVVRRTGFKVNYGPVRAEDIKEFIKTGMKASTDMRTVKFTFRDRLVLTPIELVSSIKSLVLMFGVMFILNATGIGNFAFSDLYAFLGAVIIGCVITPVLLPWIPGKAFSFKGFLLGVIWAVAVIFINGLLPIFGILKAAAYLLILPSLSAFFSMNFTGCSTYTSPSGVNKEMRIAIPLMLISSVLGVLLLIADMILRLIGVI